MGNFFHKPGELYTVLTDELIAHLRTATGFSEEEIRREHVKFFDIAEDGRLKKSYMEELLGDYIPPAKRRHAKYLTNCVFSAIDTNNDHYLDFLEYLTSIKFFQTTSPIEKADFIFRVIDKNGDHLVSRKEIERVLKCLEEYHKKSSNTHVTNVLSEGVKPAANVVLQRLDEDKNGLIGITEFTDGWLKDETIRALFSF